MLLPNGAPPPTQGCTHVSLALGYLAQNFQLSEPARGFSVLAIGGV